MENSKIFELFEKEEIHYNLHIESSHFGKEELKEKDDGHNKSIFESFATTSLNYFKDSNHCEDYFNYDTDNECYSMTSSKKELKNIIYNLSIYK